MRKWAVTLLILSSLLSGCIGLGIEAAAGSITTTIGARRGLAEACISRWGIPIRAELVIASAFAL